MFWSKNKKNRYSPACPKFCYIKVGFKGVYITQTCFRYDLLNLKWRRHDMSTLELIVIFYSFHWRGTSTVKTQTMRFRSRTETRDQREPCVTSVENQLIIGTRRNSSSFVKTVTPKVRFSKAHNWLFVVCKVCFIFIAQSIV